MDDVMQGDVPGSVPAPPPGPTDDAEMQQGHQERRLLLSTMFLWDVRYLSPATVKHIVVEALDATYRQENRELGNFAVYTSGDRARFLDIHVGRQSGDRYILNAASDVELQS